MSEMRKRVAGNTDLYDGSVELSAELRHLLDLRATLREQVRTAGLEVPQRSEIGGDEEGGDADSGDEIMAKSSAARNRDEVQDCLPLAAAAFGICVGVPVGVAALTAGATPSAVFTSALAMLAVSATARFACLPRGWSARRSRMRAADAAAAAVAATAAGALLAVATGMRAK